VAAGEGACGGELARLLSRRLGRRFKGGVVAYSNVAKVELLGVSPDLIETAGAVSPEVALAMARGACRFFGAEWGLAETGIAGPQTGRRSAKPVGLAWVAVAGPVERVLEVRTGSGRRSLNRRAFARAALDLLLAVWGEFNPEEAEKPG
jgi:PncC family amidohydrolase